jgi:hypothetical protein
MGSSRSRVRIEQSRAELASLGNEIAEWFSSRNFGAQYTTQLNNLKSILEQSIESLNQELGKIQPEKESGAVYRQCRTADRRLVWVRRVWDYYAARFDQRLHPRFAPVLQAADEVVWACYAEPVRNADKIDRPQKPAPLPYLETQYAARAFTRLDLPPEMQDKLVPQDRLAELESVLGEMPVPVIGLPQNSATSPWWLAFIAHEVGHHILTDLKPDGMKRAFYDWVSQAVLEADQEAGEAPDETAANQWFNWGDEVFADLFSVGCLGSAAAWAMVELENSDTAGMLAPLLRYPAPIVRLGLLGEAVEALGIQDRAVLGGLDPQAWLKEDPIKEGDSQDHTQARKTALANLRRARKIARKAVKEPLPGLAQPLNLAQLTGFEAKHYHLKKGRAAAWSDFFLDQNQLFPQSNVQDTRLGMAGAVLAWRAAQQMEDTERAEAVARLQQAIPKELAETREEGVRSAQHPAQAEIEKHGRALADWLLDPSMEEVF